MAYIGNIPADKYTSFAKQDFTVTATTSYTLDHSVSNENEIALFINFVRQEPTTAYTASGTSLTLTEATSVGDDMYCVFLGKAVQTVTPANGTVTGDMMSYPLTNFSSTGIDDNATSTAITIDSSENVGIGTSSPDRQLEIYDDGTNSQAVIAITAQNDNPSRIMFADTDDNNIGILDYDHSDDAMRFVTNNAERMRILNDGIVLVGRTTELSIGSSTDTGINMNPSGVLSVYRSGQPVIIGRQVTDGNLISFRQAGTEEGAIYVNGATVTYASFTGTHWSRFTDNSTPTILKGTVLETLDEMCDWYNLEFDVTDAEGNTHTEKVPHVLTNTQSVGDIVTHTFKGTDYQATIVKETDIKHMKSKVSNTVDAKNVYGVFHSYDLDGEGYNDFMVASVGSFVVRIKANETIAKGDLLQSNGDGTAKVQTDDNVKSSSFAKVLSTTVIETYDDGSFIVPCSLMC